jgi:hypothetical protein
MVCYDQRPVGACAGKVCPTRPPPLPPPPSPLPQHDSSEESEALVSPGHLAASVIGFLAACCVFAMCVCGGNFPKRRLPVGVEQRDDSTVARPMLQSDDLYDLDSTAPTTTAVAVTTVEAIAVTTVEESALLSPAGQQHYSTEVNPLLSRMTNEEMLRLQLNIEQRLQANMSHNAEGIKHDRMTMVGPDRELELEPDPDPDPEPEPQPQP